jgi:hypothetical protein
MLRFTEIPGVFSQTASRRDSARRGGKARLAVESLEGRSLMATNFLAPVPVPQAHGTLPSVQVQSISSELHPPNPCSAQHQSSTAIIAILVG